MKSTIWKAIIGDCKRILYKNVTEISNNNIQPYMQFKSYLQMLFDR